MQEKVSRVVKDFRRDVDYLARLAAEDQAEDIITVVNETVEKILVAYDEARKNGGGENGGE